MKPDLQTAIAVMYFYNGPPEEAKKAAKVLYDVGPMLELPVPELPFEQLNAQQNGADGGATRKYFKGLTIPKLTGEAIDEVFKTINKVITTLPTIYSIGGTFEFIPKDAILAVPSDKMAFAGRSKGRELLLFTAYPDAESDSKFRDEVRELATNLRQVARITTGRDARGYINYDPEPNDARDAEIVFGANYPRLRQLKRKYDPEMVFRKWFPITPAEL